MFIRAVSSLGCTLAVLLYPGPNLYGQSPSPDILSLSAATGTNRLTFQLFPAAAGYAVYTSTNLTDGFTLDPDFQLAALSVTNYSTNLVNGTNVIVTNILTSWPWQRTNAPVARGFHRVQATPLPAESQLAATVLSRLTYGPTPDDLTRIASIGADAYLAEQLAPATLTEDVTGTHTNLAAIEARFHAADEVIQSTDAKIDDLRAWHQLRAVGARRQLLEILLQFCENHFVTEWDKSRNYFAGKYDNGNLENALAAHLEHRENTYWRNALLNPQCTFYDLLEISAESPAMIIYLDTVSSRGDGKNIANENYARELLELFTFGVDNGYEQTDITISSRCWTGWTLELFDPENAFNPFASKTTNQVENLNTNYLDDAYTNLEGVWSLWYRADRHNSSTKTLFTNKYVPARFGAPWTTKTYGTNTTPGLYQLVVPGRSGTAGMTEGYELIQYLANLPFTQEYLSIKLCRLFVHDDFPNPSADPATEEHQFYNYAAGNLSPEAALVHACMLAWETNAPQGQIWKVLETIFASELFRSQAAAGQKVKTPLEYTVSAIRALRSSLDGSNLAGSFTSDTDGFALNTPLKRMGGMLLFDRDAPDGYPESGPPWISAGTLAERIRWVQSFCITNSASGHSGSQSGTGNDAQNSVCDPVALLKANILPSGDWNNAGAVADYFLGLLYPGEGAGNLAPTRLTAVSFLDDGTADTATTYRTTKFVSVPHTSASYAERVRGLVALLMTQQRFHQQ